MKRPYLMLYVADWQSNAKLRSCTHAERGLWLDVMCILHDQDEYGIIRWPLKQLAQAAHASVSALRKLVDKEILKGANQGQTCEPLIYTPRSGRKDGPSVTLVEAQPGPIWYSSRMVRDEYLRRVRGDSDSSPKPPPDPTPNPSPKGGISAGKNSAPNPSPSHASARPLRPSVSVSDPDPFSDSSSGSPALPPEDHFRNGENYTPPKNGGGETPPKTPEQIENFTIWNLGIQALRASGVTDKNARSFIGRQLKDYGRKAVAAAVIETLAQGAVAPLEYIVAVLQGRVAERQQKSKVEHTLDAVKRVIAEKMEAQHGAACS